MRFSATAFHFKAVLALFPICWMYNYAPGAEFADLVDAPIRTYVGSENDYEGDPEAGQFCASVAPGKEEFFDIDDTFYAADGGQQLALWNGHEDERGLSPMRIYHVRIGLPVVTTILRSPKTPKGTEVRTVIKLAHIIDAIESYEAFR